MIKVDLGSGRQALEVPDYVHVDQYDLPHIEHVWNLNSGLPKRTWESNVDGTLFVETASYKAFEDNTVDEFRAHHVLEHLTHDGFMKLMDELWDALKPDGELHIFVPNGEHVRAAHSDPTHRLTFTFWTFEYFTKASLAAFAYTDKPWKILYGYPRVNGEVGDLWELECIMQPDK